MFILQKNRGIGGYEMKLPVLTVTLNPAIDKTITLSDFKIGSLNRVRHMRIDPGGKGINVAKVLKEFDVDVITTGFIAGNLGQYVMKKLEQQGIPFDFSEVQGETRTNLKIVDETTNITTEINEQGFDITATDIEKLFEKINKKMVKDSILVLGGSLPNGVPSTIYRELIEMVHVKGGKVILDADGNAFKEGIEAKPYTVKPNLQELEQYVNQSLETEQDILLAGEKLLNKGISIVLISLGSKGSIIMNHQEAYRVQPFPIIPKSTVGAGDSMVAALVYCILQKKSFEECARWTSAAGTVTASKSGTQVCTLNEVQELINEVKCFKI